MGSLKTLPILATSLSGRRLCSVMCGIAGHVSLNAEPLKASPSVVHAMTHSVENRCPFLYHSFIELCMTLPVKLRVRALNEKHLLKKAFESSLPAAITKRRKRPFTTFCVHHRVRLDFGERN